MANEVGTRSKQNFGQLHTESASISVGYTRDKGMSKRIVTSATFTASNGRVTGSTNDFTSFAVGDQVEIFGTNKNNGCRGVTGIDVTNHAFLVLDYAPKDEGPVANTEIRTV
jgi:hypothetical protein